MKKKISNNTKIRRLKKEVKHWKGQSEKSNHAVDYWIEQKKLKEEELKKSKERQIHMILPELSKIIDANAHLTSSISRMLAERTY